MTITECVTTTISERMHTKTKKILYLNYDHSIHLSTIRLALCWTVGGNRENMQPPPREALSPEAFLLLLLLALLLLTYINTSNAHSWCVCVQS